MRIGADRAANLHKLRYVYSPLAKLNFRDECLSLSDALSQFDLRDARVLPSLNEPLDDALIKIGS